VRGLLQWGGALAGAGVIHAGAAAALIAAVAPDPRREASEPPESRLDLAVATVPRTSATEVPGTGTEARRATAEQAALASGSVPSARAVAVAAPMDRVQSVAAPVARPSLGAVPTDIPAKAPEPVAARPVVPDAARVEGASPLAEPATEVGRTPDAAAPVALLPETLPVPPPPALSAASLRPDPVRLTGASAGPGVAAEALGETGTPVAPSPAPAASVRVSSVLGAALAATVPVADPAASPPPPATAAPRAEAAALPARLEAPPSSALSEVMPQAERTTATVGWSGSVGAALQGATLDAVEAFLSPAPDAAGQAVRDGLGAQLSSVACARVQTVFDPETGAVEIRGHVPGPEDRDLLVAAVEAELRGGLPVTDRLLELPRPQCSVLAGLAAAGLAQSTEQFTNPLIIGPDAHARVYHFRSGDAMKLDIGGADYGGWLTLDYFDSAGNVVHLVPSGAVPELWLDPQEAVAFGGGGPRDVTGGRVRVEIGPPYGKDIAVALVSSQPLFAEPRPPVEPAGAYLADLARRVAELRADDPGFKAEWVYLFVATSP
jgi:hypothetical protein